MGLVGSGGALTVAGLASNEDADLAVRLFFERPPEVIAARFSPIGADEWHGVSALFVFPDSLRQPTGCRSYPRRLTLGDRPSPAEPTGWEFLRAEATWRQLLGAEAARRQLFFAAEAADGDRGLIGVAEDWCCVLDVYLIFHNS